MQRRRNKITSIAEANIRRLKQGSQLWRYLWCNYVLHVIIIIHYVTWYRYNALV